MIFWWLSMCIEYLLFDKFVWSLICVDFSVLKFRAVYLTFNGKYSQVVQVGFMCLEFHSCWLLKYLLNFVYICTYIILKVPWYLSGYIRNEIIEINLRLTTKLKMKIQKIDCFDWNRLIPQNSRKIKFEICHEILRR